MKTQHAIAILAFLAAAPLVRAVPAAAQQDDQEWLDRCRRETSNRNRERFCEVRTETFRAGSGAIRVDPGQNGGVSVESWSGSDVEVQARIQAEAPEMSRATAMARAIRVGHSGNAISASGPDMEDRESWSVTYVIRVPRSSDLEIKALNGPVGIHNVRGRIDASTVNGPLSLTDVAGDVHAETRNGPLTVRLAGARWEGTGLDAQTSNGPVSLMIPEDYNADLETGTVNGPFNTEIPLNVRMLGERTTKINTKIGNGGAPVRVVTTNGPISIRKR